MTTRSARTAAFGVVAALLVTASPTGMGAPGNGVSAAVGDEREVSGTLGPFRSKPTVASGGGVTVETWVEILVDYRVERTDEVFVTHKESCGFECNHNAPVRDHSECTSAVCDRRDPVGAEHRVLVIGEFEETLNYLGVDLEVLGASLLEQTYSEFLGKAREIAKQRENLRIPHWNNNPCSSEVRGYGQRRFDFRVTPRVTKRTVRREGGRESQTSESLPPDSSVMAHLFLPEKEPVARYPREVSCQCALKAQGGGGTLITPGTGPAGGGGQPGASPTPQGGTRITPGGPPPGGATGQPGTSPTPGSTRITPGGTPPCGPRGGSPGGSLKPDAPAGGRAVDLSDAEMEKLRRAVREAERKHRLSAPQPSAPASAGAVSPMPTPSQPGATTTAAPPAGPTTTPATAGPKGPTPSATGSTSTTAPGTTGGAAPGVSPTPSPSSSLTDAEVDALISFINRLSAPQPSAPGSAGAVSPTPPAGAVSDQDFAVAFWQGALGLSGLSPLAVGWLQAAMGGGPMTMTITPPPFDPPPATAPTTPTFEELEKAEFGPVEVGDPRKPTLDDLLDCLPREFRWSPSGFGQLQGLGFTPSGGPTDVTEQNLFLDFLRALAEVDISRALAKGPIPIIARRDPPQERRGWPLGGPAAWRARARAIVAAWFYLPAESTAAVRGTSHATPLPAGSIVRIEATGAGQAQAAGEIAVSLVATGRSSGEVFQLRVFNPAKQPVHIVAPDGLVVQPLGRSAAQAVATRAKGNLKALSVMGYCLDFVKPPPVAGTLYRVADQALQDQFRPLRFVLRAGQRLTNAGRLTPDSDPKAYVDSIKQWALWVKREGWNAETFGRHFVERTKKNVQELKRSWTKEMETAIRGAVPNRWRDITAVLEEAGALEAAAGRR